MRKIYYQLHISFILSSVLYIIAIGVGITGIIMGVTDIKSYLPAVPCGMFIAIYFAYSFFSIAYYRIILFSDRIHATGEFGNSEVKTQFKDDVYYCDIADIRLVYINKNSKKKGFSGPAYGNLRPRMFFEFVLNNGKTKWIYISYFSKKQRNEILSIVNRNTGLNASYDQMYEDLRKQFQRRK